MSKISYYYLSVIVLYLAVHIVSRSTPYLALVFTVWIAFFGRLIYALLIDDKPVDYHYWLIAYIFCHFMVLQDNRAKAIIENDILLPILGVPAISFINAMLIFFLTYIYLQSFITFVKPKSRKFLKIPLFAMFIMTCVYLAGIAFDFNSEPPIRGVRGVIYVGFALSVVAPLIIRLYMESQNPAEQARIVAAGAFLTTAMTVAFFWFIAAPLQILILDEPVVLQSKMDNNYLIIILIILLPDSLLAFFRIPALLFKYLRLRTLKQHILDLREISPDIQGGVIERKILPTSWLDAQILRLVMIIHDASLPLQVSENPAALQLYKNIDYAISSGWSSQKIAEETVDETADRLIDVLNSYEQSLSGL